MDVDVDELLLHAAERCATQTDIQSLVRTIAGIAFQLPGIRAAGAGLRDEERQVTAVYLVECGAPDAVVRETTPFTGLTIEPPTPREPSAVVDLRGSAEAWHARLRGCGAEWAAQAPICVDGRDLGLLFVATTSADACAAELGEFLERLAPIVVPALRSCYIHERFTRGDRRRDALIAMYHGINRSLQPDAVLEVARDVVGRLEGHCVSEFGLLDEGGATYRSYRRHSPPGEAARSYGPEVLRVSDGVASWLIEHRRTFESDDLAERPRFPSDAGLLRLGVRRYVAAPMFARDRIIGALLFGTTDVHPPLRMDVWLYENMALQIGLAIDNALQHEQVRALSQRLNQQTLYLQEEIRSENSPGGLVGGSAAIRGVLDAVRRVAGASTTVLIHGETGVGKELVARAIHEQSRVAGQPMVKVNCAAIPESMVESELFGHERGAFTSAVERRIGRFELARDSTLFLDEIGELSLGVQAKLLRVLQDGEFERVGGVKTITSNARIIAATNRDLSKAVEAGTFRRDLFYRVNVFPIFVPPLRERREDVPALVEAFVAQLARRMGKPVARVEPAVVDELAGRDWPGNVRELRSTIERAMILCDGKVLDLRALDPRSASPSSPPPADPIDPSAFASLKDAEALHIRAALERTRGIVEGPHGAAALLGMKASTLRYRLRTLGIRRPRLDAGPGSPA